MIRLHESMSRLKKLREKPPEREEFNVMLVKCCEPIMIKDELKTEDEKKPDDDSGYPPGYDDVFDYIFQPEEWEENGKTWRRVASTKPANREEVLELQKSLWSNMAYWQARIQGLCPVRRELFSQCFDELIRQVSIINVNRGELLVRIRNDSKSTIECYKQLFEDCLMYSIRKSAVAGQGIEEIENDVKNLEQKSISLKNELVAADNKYKILKEKLSEELNALKIANQHEFDFYSKNHDALKGQLETILTMQN